MKSFIVKFWAWIFSGLEKISLFWVVRWVVGKRFADTSRIYRFIGSYGFTDVWVVGHFLLSIFLLSVCSALNLHWGNAIATGGVIYGGFRVVEVLSYLINVLLFDEYREKKKEYEERKKAKIYTSPYALRGYRRIIILLLHNYVEIILWFALFYRHWDWAFETGRASLNSFFDALSFSFVTMTKLGYTTIYPKETSGDILVLIQSAVGLFMVLLILARFISLLPKPKTLDEFER